MPQNGAIWDEMDPINNRFPLNSRRILTSTFDGSLLWKSWEGYPGIISPPTQAPFPHMPRFNTFVNELQANVMSRRTDHIIASSSSQSIVFQLLERSTLLHSEPVMVTLQLTRSRRILLSITCTDDAILVHSSRR